jgi:Flp pilus assembly protein TadB
MPNRAERRAQAKRGRQSNQDKFETTRSRAGVVDEYALQERSRHLVEDGGTGWKPKAETVATLNEVADPDLKNPKVLRAPHSMRQWFRVASWVLIVLAAAAFFVVMWLPKHPMWLMIVVSAVFVVGVISLFFTAGDYHDNPNLDENGTAV